MRYKNPYCLFKKTLKSGTKIWYYSFYDETGKRRQLSTGQKTKSLAMRVCHTLYSSGAMYPNLPNSIPQLATLQSNIFLQNIISMTAQNNSAQIALDKNQYPEKKTNSPTFKEYTKNWFIHDKCEYTQQKLLHGFTVTRVYAERRRWEVERKLVPFFGRLTIDKITEEVVEEFIKKSKRINKLKNSTINTSLKTLKQILAEAYRKGDLDKDVAKKIRLLKLDSKTHGVFTDEEVEKILDKKHIADRWNGKKTYYGMNLIASKTGMRIGEVQALMKKNVFPDHILVAHGWNEKYGLCDTKNHKSRTVPISSELYDFIMELSNQNSEGEYIFSMSKGRTPAVRTDMNRHFVSALEKIGISKEEKAERFLSFHSWRHYVNSKLINSGVPKSIVQSVIGHVNDDAMTEHYTHVSLEEQRAVLGVVWKGHQKSSSSIHEASSIPDLSELKFSNSILSVSRTSSIFL